MDLEDLEAVLAVRSVDQHLPVETTGPQQRRIQDLWAVRRRQEDHAGARIEAVELGQELVERLFLFIVAADRSRHTAAAKRIEFVNEK